MIILIWVTMAPAPVSSLVSTIQNGYVAVLSVIFREVLTVRAIFIVIPLMIVVVRAVIHSFFFCRGPIVMISIIIARTLLVSLIVLPALVILLSHGERRSQRCGQGNRTNVAISEMHV
ncbi:MAG: hypothetical protein NVS1B11_07340 [Terriglobales bacterium]